MVLIIHVWHILVEALLGLFIYFYYRKGVSPFVILNRMLLEGLHLYPCVYKMPILISRMSVL